MSLPAKNATPQYKMSEERFEGYDNIVRSALKRFLERIQCDTSKSFYDNNDDSNHPYSLYMMLGMQFDDTMMLLESSSLTDSRKSESVETDDGKLFYNLKLLCIISMMVKKMYLGSLLGGKSFIVLDYVLLLLERIMHSKPKHVFGKNMYKLSRQPCQFFFQPRFSSKFPLLVII